MARPRRRGNDPPAVERGVEFARYEGIEQDELGVWRAPGGARIAWFRDPDGNTVSLTQLPPSPSPVSDLSSANQDVV